MAAVRSEIYEYSSAWIGNEYSLTKNLASHYKVTSALDAIA